MNLLHTFALAIIAISAALGLVVNPVILLVPAGFFALLLFLRFPEILMLFAITVGMVMPQAQMIDLGIPSVGVNLLDFAVFVMLFSVVLRWSEVKTATSRERLLRYLLWFVAVAGTVALVNGYFSGYGLRTALRSFRFYFYLIVTFYFAALIPELHQLRRIVVGWMMLVPIQLFLLYTQKVIYSPDDPGMLVFATDIYWTSIHFLPIKSYFPMLIGLALLALIGRRLGVPLKAALWSLVALQILVLAFSYRRSHYVGMVAGLLLLLLAVLIVMPRRGQRLLPLLAKPVGISLVLIVFSSTAFLLTGRLLGVDTEKALDSIKRRFFFTRQIATDAPIQDRLEGFRIGWSDIQQQFLLGTGLGHSVTYERAQIFHSGWLWVAVSAGVPAALGLAFAIGLCCIRTLKTLGRWAENPVLSALRLGFLTSLVALSGSALFWGSTLDIADVFDWGLLMGLLTVLMPRERGVGLLLEPQVSKKRHKREPRWGSMSIFNRRFQNDKYIGVMYLMSAPFPAGALYGLRSIVRQLDQQRFRPVVVLPEEHRELTSFFNGMDVELATAHSRSLSPWHPLSALQLVRTVWDLVQLVQKYNVRILHSTAPRAALLGPVVWWLTGVKFVWQIAMLGQPWYLHFLARFPDKVPTVSHAVYEEFGCRPNMEVVYNGPWTENLCLEELNERRQKLREELGIANSALVVGSIANIQYWKGIHVFLKAFAHVVRQMPETILVHLGGPVRHTPN